MLEIIPIDTPSLGDRSYLVHDGRVALVVDPQRDLDRVLALAEQHGVRITHVFETHIHNDYVTGGLALATATGAAYHVNADDPVTFARVPVRDGDAIQVAGTMRVRVLATPGHTFTHLAYVLEVDAVPVGVFTGGSLLYGSTGRPDLLGPGDATTLARLQFGSARRLAAGLPDATPVLPTHGFGSFCSATQAEGTSSTIGQEKRGNPALTLGEGDYAEALLAGLDVWPAYYAHMAPANLAGPHTPDLSPPAPADARELRRRLDAGEWVVDVRSRAAFAAGHVPGTLSFSLDGSFATYLGWLIPWGMPLTLLGETSGQVAEAQRELARIGIDRPVAAAAGRRPRGRQGGRARRAPPSGVVGGAHRRRCPHPAARVAAPARRRASGPGVGGLPQRLLGDGRRVHARRPRPGRRRGRRRVRQRRRGRPAPRAASGIPAHRRRRRGPRTVRSRPCRRSSAAGRWRRPNRPGRSSHAT